MTSKKRTIQTGLIKQWVAAIMFACGSLTAVGQWQTQSLTLSPGWNAVYLHVDSMHSGIAAMANGTPVEEVWLWPVSYTHLTLPTNREV